MSLPTCSRCGRIAILNPCRECASPAELKKYPPAPWVHELDRIESERA